MKMDLPIPNKLKGTYRMNIFRACLLLSFPSNVVNIILEYNIVIEIQKMLTIDYNRYISFPNASAYTLFFANVLKFSLKFNMTQEEFDNWFQSGLKIGFIRDNHLCIYELPNGEHSRFSEISNIYNYMDLSNYRIKDDKHYRPVCKFVSSSVNTHLEPSHPDHVALVNTHRQDHQRYHRRDHQRYHRREEQMNRQKVQKNTKNKIYKYRR